MDMMSTARRARGRTVSLAALLSSLVAAPAPVMLAAQGAAPAASPPDWLLAFDGRSTNDVAHDPRLGRLITRQIPAAMATTLRDALGGPPDPLQVTDGRTVAMSACQPRACGTKGFLWLDLAAGTALGAIYEAPTLRLGSRALAPDTLPAAARTALLAWLADLDAVPRTVRFTNAAGSVTRLAAAPFTPTGRYRPPPGGPSFDCAGAASPVARTLCRDTALAALDLRTWRQAEEVRRGHSTRAAREELVAFHEAWRHRRDVRCGAAADRSACLREELASQYEALRHWLPRSARP
jgi:hypothetical protein